MNVDDLTHLGTGEGGIVLEVMGESSSAKRLADMGFIGGAQVVMLKPGTPCLVRIGGRCVGLGKALQRGVRVERVTPWPNTAIDLGSDLVGASASPVRLQRRP